MAIRIEEVPGIPFINEGDDIGDIITGAIESSGIELVENDILCVASKVISTSERRFIKLDDVQASEKAQEIHGLLPRKDPRTIQLIIDQTGDPTGGRLEMATNYIAGWTPNGMRLTSAGVDKVDAETVILIPEDADRSARKLGKTIFERLGVQVGVIITDSDGRAEKAGSTQVAIGLYGVPGLRVSEGYDKAADKMRRSEETTSDLLAGAAALIMGQRGTNKPVVRISGFEYEFDENSSIVDSLSRVPAEYVRPIYQD